jgi:pimeloyl-ACP methyl ester carboxylesterase
MFFSVGTVGVGTPTATPDEALRWQAVPESLTLPGGGAGDVLILGGFGLSTVYLFRSLAERLAQHGYGASIRNLVGSRGDYDELRRVTAEDFFEDITTTLETSRGSRPMTVIAFSTSALVVPLILAERPDLSPDGLILISTPLGVRDRLFQTLGPFIAYTCPPRVKPIFELLWFRGRGRRVLKPEIEKLPQFHWLGARATSELVPLQDRFKSLAPCFPSVRTLFLHGTRDGKCSTDLIREYVERVAQPSTTLEVIDGGRHTMSVGSDAAAMENAVIRFITSL